MYTHCHTIGVCLCGSPHWCSNIISSYDIQTTQGTRLILIFNITPTTTYPYHSHICQLQKCSYNLDTATCKTIAFTHTNVPSPDLCITQTSDIKQYLQNRQKRGRENGNFPWTVLVSTKQLFKEENTRETDEFHELVWWCQEWALDVIFLFMYKQQALQVMSIISFV